MPGADGRPGIPGNPGNVGQPGVIEGGTIVPAFGVAQLAQGEFSLKFNGPPGTAYVIQASSNLSAWTPVLTNTAPFTFSDLASRTYRFYRVGH
jgi:hypothetical protein